MAAQAAEGSHNHEAAPVSAKVLYTCGMHPEVISDTPGNCPKCGMKLTPMDPDRARMILEALGETPQNQSSSSERRVVYWRSSMDPAYVSDKPGQDTMGMELVPVYEDEVTGGPTIRIDPVTSQNMGLRLAEIRQGPLDRVVRTVAMIDYDETTLATVSPRIDGWVERVHVDQVGAQVHAGDPLFDIYAPELYSAQEELLQAARDARTGGTSGDLARRRLASARDRLRLFDIADAQIESIEREGEVRRALTIAARATGVVTEKNIVAGDYLEAGKAAYKIADLSTVWVIGRIFESDLPFVRLGQEARMQLDYLPGRTHRGRLTYIYPYLKTGTREVPVRMEFHNPGYELKPGMYATIEIRARVADQTTLLPAPAVIDTGQRKIAFVMTEPGKFQPRRLTLGPRGENDEFQVITGVAPGERVVISGQFLLDSEARLREATIKMLQPGLVKEETAVSTETTVAATQANTRWVCPMPEHASILYDQPGDCHLCGMKMVPAAPWQTEAQAISHYTCPMPEHADIQMPSAGKCPLCGMTLIPVMEELDTRAAGPPSEAATSMPAETLTLYTCPMEEHADVVSDQPGKCPKCEMNLVPTSDVEHGAQSEAVWRTKHADAPTTASTATSPIHVH